MMRRAINFRFVFPRRSLVAGWWSSYKLNGVYIGNNNNTYMWAPALHTSSRNHCMSCVWKTEMRDAGRATPSEQRIKMNQQQKTRKHASLRHHPCNAFVNDARQAALIPLFDCFSSRVSSKPLTATDDAWLYRVYMQSECMDSWFQRCEWVWICVFNACKASLGRWCDECETYVHLWWASIRAVCNYTTVETTLYNILQRSVIIYAMFDLYECE